MSIMFGFEAALKPERGLGASTVWPVKQPKRGLTRPENPGNSCANVEDKGLTIRRQEFSRWCAGNEGGGGFLAGIERAMAAPFHAQGALQKRGVSLQGRRQGGPAFLHQ